MATPVGACGFECGLAQATLGPHWDAIVGTGSITTSSPLTGTRSLLLNPTAGTGAVVGIPSFGAGIVVFRIKLNFGASLPAASCFLAGVSPGGGADSGAYFNSSDSKIYAGTGTGALGATGVSVTTNTTYSIDVRVNSTANPWLIDVQVDASACGQRSTANTAVTSASNIRLGNSTGTHTYTLKFDDLLVSATTGDYPLGPGYVNHFVPTSDGTHNVASSADFQRGNTAVDITNATTTAFQLVDDVPLPSGAVSEADNWRAVAPPNATDYVEGKFGAAPGISTPTTAPRAVEAVLVHHQIATQTGSMKVDLNDNGTVDSILNISGAAGVTTYRYARKHYASGPAGTWVIGGGGNGDFTDLRCRFYSADAAPDQCLDAIMIEAEFVEEEAGNILAADLGTYSLTGVAAGLKSGRKLTADVGSYAVTGVNPTLKGAHKLTAETGNYALTGINPTLRAVRHINAAVGTYTLTGVNPTLAKGYRLSADTGSYALTGVSVGFQAAHKIAADLGTYALTGVAPTLTGAHKIAANLGTYALTGVDPSLLSGRRLAANVGSYTVTGVDPSLEQGRKLAANVGSYTLTGNDANLVHGTAGEFTLTAELGTYSLTGVNAGLRATRKLSADVGSYALNGVAATLQGAHKLSAETGSYALSGVAATLSGAHKIAANLGTYTLTGVDVTLSTTGAFKLTADVGAYSLTGINPSLVSTRKIAPDVGSYTLTGVNPSLEQGYRLIADTGNYALSGVAADLRAARKLTADVGSYQLTGTAATLTRGRTMSVDAGVYTLTGVNAGLTSVRRLSCNVGSYILSGVDLDLLFSQGSFSLFPDVGSYALTGVAPNLFKTPVPPSERISSVGGAVRSLIPADSRTYTPGGESRTS